ncbi:GreA/GreB family elongation factor [Flavobacterium sp. MFBS3-15]|uniref:GreA/GreB family elongation factor n=1 Tax=Flavobacterium sp. MFBS3-15 TaxID=2989816 RepID=UPI0022366BC6|nr:GreA/GreB family elongation factor [Flavobacterium sp. MFBS3-15]MCW4469788.1 GreA/GreB family elongation factor [Flavobacterium sp. MFBS3-15]
MTPILKQTDYTIITNLINNLSYYQKTREVDLILEELKKADIVADEDIKADIIQLFSKFDVEDVESKKIFSLSITPPHLANFKEKKISVFSPLAVALIGHRKGMTVEWLLPGGLKKLYIKSVMLQQPVK